MLIKSQEVFMMQIGEVIRKYRKERNLTQEEMANRLGVTAPAVNKWENANSLPDVLLLAPIARRIVAEDEIPDPEQYDDYIKNCYVRALASENESIRCQAADSLFEFYVRKEQYEKAEECLSYFTISICWQCRRMIWKKPICLLKNRENWQMFLIWVLTMRLPANWNLQR
jgi:transcriptional regulator with XRE-family HTH domain